MSVLIVAVILGIVVLAARARPKVDVTKEEEVETWTADPVPIPFTPEPREFVAWPGPERPEIMPYDPKPVFEPRDEITYWIGEPYEASPIPPPSVIEDLARDFARPGGPGGEVTGGFELYSQVRMD